MNGNGPSPDSRLDIALSAAMLAAAMKIVLVFLVSWLAGIAAYLGAGALFYRQAIGWGDLSAVLFWSLLAFALAFFLVYLPALLGLRRLLHGVRPGWPFPLVAVLLGVVPTAIIISVWGGLSFRALVSPEASLFYAMFATVGVVVGFAFTRIYRSAPVAELQGGGEHL